MSDSDRNKRSGQPKAGLSVWWPTPSRVDRSFSPAQLDYSERVHGPLRRAAIFLLASRTFLLAVAILAIAIVARTHPVGDLKFAGRLAVGAGLSIVALRLPPILIDTWIEYRHRPAMDGAPTTPWWYFTRTVIALNLVYSAVLLGSAWFAYWLSGRVISSWSFPTIAALGLASILGATRSSINHPAIPERQCEIGDDLEIDTAKLIKLATPLTEHFGLDTSVEVSSDDRYALGCNAYSSGSRRRGRIVVGRQLCNEPSLIVSFVIAHELAHLVNRHLTMQRLIAFVLNSLGVVLFFLLSTTNRFWSFVNLEGPSDPLGMPVVVGLSLLYLGVCRLIKSWLGRAHERIADRDAAAVVGVLEPHQGQRLYARSGADLSPPWCPRVLSSHPSPSERVEYLARLRR